LLITVKASIAGAGANEAGFDTRPVYDATVVLGHARATANRSGIATLRIPRHPKQRLMITATAGDTFTPATLELGRPNSDADNRRGRLAAARDADFQQVAAVVVPVADCSTPVCG
jgi:hypothetical protein